MSDYLPSTVLTNILSRLEVKTLGRFRCVCKSWCSIISSPNFINKHLAHNISNTHLLLRYLSLCPKKEHYSLRSDYSFLELARIKCPFKTASGNFFRIIGCCNGLICLSDDYFGYRYNTIIWNPAIRIYVSLPTPRVCYDSYGPYTYALGFGFNPNTVDYKVVRIAYVYVDDESGSGYGRYAVPPEVEVYEVSTGVWRNVSVNGVMYKVVEFIWSSAFVSGAVHWVVYDRNEEGGGEEGQFSNRILVFDMGSDVFSYLELPNQLANVYPLDLSIAAFGDTVVVYWCQARVLGRLCGRCAVWVMQEYGNVESWSERFLVDLEGGISNVVGFRKSGELLLEKWIGSLVSYDPESDRIRSVGIHGGKDSFFMGNYVKSLALLDAQKEVLGEHLKFVDGADVEEEPASSERERANEETDLLMSLVTRMFLASAPLHL
ncbi:hypothetical protein LguiA_022348 [Lonicera macranthoides]